MNTVEYKKQVRNKVTCFLFLFFGALGSFTVRASDSYDETFSYRYTALTGYELSEDGLREALENYENSDPKNLDKFDLENLDDISKGRRHIFETITVIGEQKYANLADELKAMYARKTVGPDVGSLTTVQGKDGRLYRLRAHIARALVRCNDPEGERYALEQALDTPRMDVVTAAYAIETLKYLVKEYGTYVGAELEFLINLETGEGEWQHTGVQIHELCEIEKYTRAIDSPDARKYTEIIERLESTGTTKVKRAFRWYKDRRPDWLPTRELIDAAGN